MDYYYLAASLPMLSLEGPLPFPTAAFRERCREQLSPSDAEELDCLLDRQGVGARSAFTQTWRDHDIRLRNAVARIRAARRGFDATPFLRAVTGFDAGVEKAVADCFQHASPLERERALDRLRWQILEQLAGFNPFALRSLLAYALKLQLVENTHRINPELGRHALDTHLESGAARETQVS